MLYKRENMVLEIALEMGPKMGALFSAYAPINRIFSVQSPSLSGLQILHR